MTKDLGLIDISNGAVVGVVAAGAGGLVLSARRDSRDLLRPAPAPEAASADPRLAACFPCVPYFGRLYGGLYFEGRRWDQKPTLAGCDSLHATHGEGWISRWRVAARQTDAATLRLAHSGRTPGRFPFPFEAEQRIRATQEGIEIRLALINAGRKRMPASPGLHPYFARRPDTRLKFSAAAFWTPPEIGHSGWRSAVPASLDFARGGALPADTLDHSFENFCGVVVIESGGRQIVLRSDAPHLHIYAPAGADYFCLEPIAGLPGDVATGALDPGATRSLAMTVEEA